MQSGVRSLALAFFAACLLMATSCSDVRPFNPPGLAEAAADYPPLLVVGTVHGTDGEIPRSCPTAGGRVEQKGSPAMEYLGADPSNPDLCRMKIGDDTVAGWYGIWLTDWPGAAQAYPALRQIIHGHTGDVAGLDVIMNPERQYHDLMRNEGIEDIVLLGKTYHAMKISHYREGFGGNMYRSVSTIWKDIPSGLLIYGTYQHISGTPELDDPLIPTAISPAP